MSFQWGQITIRQPSHFLLLQEMAGGWTANQRDKARVTSKKAVPEAAQFLIIQTSEVMARCFLSDSSSPRTATVCHNEQARMTGHKMKASSVHPIQSSSQPHLSRRAPQDRAAQNSRHAFKEQYQVGLCYRVVWPLGSERAILVHKDRVDQQLCQKFRTNIAAFKWDHV